MSTLVPVTVNVCSNGSLFFTAKLTWPARAVGWPGVNVKFVMATETVEGAGRVVVVVAGLAVVGGAVEGGAVVVAAEVGGVLARVVLVAGGRAAVVGGDAEPPTVVAVDGADVDAESESVEVDVGVVVDVVVEASLAARSSSSPPPPHAQRIRTPANIARRTSGLRTSGSWRLRAPVDRHGIVAAVEPLAVPRREPRDELEADSGTLLVV